MPKNSWNNIEGEVRKASKESGRERETKTERERQRERERKREREKLQRLPYIKQIIHKLVLEYGVAPTDFS